MGLDRRGRGPSRRAPVDGGQPGESRRARGPLSRPAPLLIRIDVDDPGLAGIEGTIDSDHVAALLGRHRNWVRRMAAEGELPSLRFGSEWRFWPEEILGYIEARRLKPGDLAWNDGKGWVRQRGFRQSSPGSAAKTFG